MNKLKFYSFDWDDNLVYMPTKIHLLKDGEVVSVSTKEYATIRLNIPENGYEYLPAGGSFCDFTKSGDEKFKLDSLNAESGPSWIDFVTCVNKARIFSIITARGHSRGIMSETVEEMIRTNHNGLDLKAMLDSMQIFFDLLGQKGVNIQQIKEEEKLLKYYLKLARFYPISNQNVSDELGVNGSVSSPEIIKQVALYRFIKHIKKATGKIIHKDFSPSISIGFSDDDENTIINMHNFLTNNGFGSNIYPFLWNTSSGKVVSQEI